MPADTTSFPRRYPFIEIDRIKNPSRLYAIPILGMFIKIVMLIPVAVFTIILGIGAIILTIINSFSVLFTGKYMQQAYALNAGLTKYVIKTSFFVSGLTNTYPGFSFEITDKYSVEIPFPKNPNRWFAVPLLGGIVRLLFLIPIFIYVNIIRNATNIALFFSWIPVLFSSYYPETTHELARDSTRVDQSIFMYLTGLSDRYPSFWISMNHKNMKIFLIILGALFVLLNNNHAQSPTNSHKIIPSKTVPTSK